MKEAPLRTGGADGRLQGGFIGGEWRRFEVLRVDLEGLVLAQYAPGSGLNEFAT